MREGDPGYRLYASEIARQRLDAETQLFEKAHLIWLLAAVPAMAFAAWHGWHIQAALLAISDVIVNVYPIMLQRHTRARLAAIRLDRQSRQ